MQLRPPECMLHCSILQEAAVRNYALQALFAGITLHGRKRSGQGRHQADHLPADGVRADPCERHVEVSALVGLDEADQFRRRGRHGLARVDRRAREEISGRHAEGFRNHRETTRTHPVGALFIFLDLLEGDAEPVGQGILAHTGQPALRLDLAADFDVDRIGDLRHSISPDRLDDVVSLGSLPGIVPGQHQKPRLLLVPPVCSIEQRNVAASSSASTA